MAKKNLDEGGGNWMDTYGDMVTLLLTFFVMLYSMSSVSEEKWAELVKAFNIMSEDQVDQIVINPDNLIDGDGILENSNQNLQEGAGAEKLTDNEMDLLFLEIQKYIQDNNMQNSIVAEIDDENNVSVDNPEGNIGTHSKNIYIQFKDNVLFMPDESVMRDGSEEVISFLGECLYKVRDDIALVIIKGHTADAPSSVVDSRILSSERASTISNYLERECKIESTLLYPIGLAGDYPIATNDTEEGRTQNRRVEIVIIGKNSDLVKSGDLLKILGASFETGTADFSTIGGE